MTSLKDSRANVQIREDLGIDEAGFALDLVLQLVQLREQRGLSQAELASRVGTRQQAISRLEDPLYSRHSLRTLRAIARELNAYIDVVFVPREQVSTYLTGRYQPVLQQAPSTPDVATEDSAWPHPRPGGEEKHSQSQRSRRGQRAPRSHGHWIAYPAAKRFSLGVMGGQITTIVNDHRTVGTVRNMNIRREQDVAA